MGISGVFKLLVSTRAALPQSLIGFNARPMWASYSCAVSVGRTYL